MIKVSWTPDFCLLYKKTNFNDVCNRKVALNNRVATFEGPEHLCESESVASYVFSEELQKACKRIVEHIQVISGGNIQVSKLVLYFKLDDNNRLWLLFCTGLKFRERNELTMRKIELKMNHPQNKRPNTPVLVLKDSQKQSKKTKSQKLIYHIEGDIQEFDPKTCFQCNLPNQSNLYTLTVQKVLEYWETYPEEIARFKSEDNLIIDVSQNIPRFTEESHFIKNEVIKKDALIPDIIYKLYPLITMEQYQQVRKEKKTLDHVVNVCLDCYMMLTETVMASKSSIIAKSLQNKLKASIKTRQDPQSLGFMMAIAQSQPKHQEELEMHLASDIKRVDTAATHTRAKSMFNDTHKLQIEKLNKIKEVPKVKGHIKTSSSVTRGTMPSDDSSVQSLKPASPANFLTSRVASPFEAASYRTIRTSESSRKDNAINGNNRMGANNNNRLFNTTAMGDIKGEHFGVKSKDSISHKKSISEVAAVGKGVDTYHQRRNFMASTAQSWKQTSKRASQDTHDTDVSKRVQTALPSITINSPKGLYGDHFHALTSRLDSRGKMSESRGSTLNYTNTLWSNSTRNEKSYRNNFSSVAGTIRDLRKFLKSEEGADL